MIINATIGTGFKGALLYVHQIDKNLKEEERPEIIEKNNVIGSNPTSIAYQMREQSQESGRVKKPVLHLSFSFSEQDKITPQKEIEAVKSALEHFGVTENKHQYVLVKHNDHDNHNHNHYHAIINKVDNENVTLNTEWLHNKCQGIADRVEQEHNLARTQRQRIYDKEKDEYRFTTKEEKAKIVKSKQTKVFKDKAPKLNEYQTKIQTGIRESLNNKEIKTFDDLQKDLAKNNIQTKLRLDDDTKEVKGISFRYDGKLSVKGGDIGYTSTIIANKLEENRAIQIQSTTKAPKTKAQKYENQFNHYFDKPELAKPNQVPGAKSAPGPTTKVEPKVEPKAIRPISDFDIILKSKGEEYGVVGYSKDFKYILLQTKEGKKLTPKNDKNYTFKLRSNKEFNGIEMDLLNRGKTFHIKEKTPYKIYKSETNESILFSNLTQDECLKAGLYNTDTFISQDMKNDFDDSSISDIDRKKRKIIPKK